MQLSMLIQGRRLENAAKHQATLFSSNADFEHLERMLKPQSWALPSSMTDHTILCHLPRAISFLQSDVQLLLSYPEAEGFARQLLDPDSHLLYSEQR